MQVESNHVANLAVARKICTSCLEKDKCVKNCGDYIFETNDEFCEWLFGSDNKDSIAVAHNMKSYDGYFIMNYIMNNITPEDKMPKCILNGSKLLVIDFNGIKIIDSINFIPMALAKFPKTFGLSELKKGYFPHFFNIPKNQNYKGPYPPPEDYGAEFMSVEDNMTFIKWHTSKNDEIFDFKKELIDYCKSDVDILSKACLIFRDLFMKITKRDENDTGVDPFIQCLTMPAACHYVYRRNLIP